MKVLKARLYDRALADQQKEISAERKSQVGTGDRSERIRTYNFPQGRISDHGTGDRSERIRTYNFPQGRISDHRINLSL